MDHRNRSFFIPPFICSTVPRLHNSKPFYILYEIGIVNFVNSCSPYTFFIPLHSTKPNDVNKPQLLRSAEKPIHTLNLLLSSSGSFVWKYTIGMFSSSFIYSNIWIYWSKRLLAPNLANTRYSVVSNRWENRKITHSCRLHPFTEQYLPHHYFNERPLLTIFKKNSQSVLTHLQLQPLLPLTFRHRFSIFSQWSYRYANEGSVFL